MTFVLDTSAIFRYIDNEAGAEQVRALLQQRKTGSAKLEMCAVNWAEAVELVLRRLRAATPFAALLPLNSLFIDVIPVTKDRATRAAEMRHRYGIPLADSFGVELASTSPHHILVTADFDVMGAANDIRIEFLPAKTKS